MNKPRFSKKMLAKLINAKLERYNFDGRNGYSQVIGKGEEINRDYGEFSVLLDLYRELNLNEVDDE